MIVRKRWVAILALILVLFCVFVLLAKKAARDDLQDLRRLASVDYTTHHKASDLVKIMPGGRIVPARDVSVRTLEIPSIDRRALFEELSRVKGARGWIAYGSEEWGDDVTYTKSGFGAWIPGYEPQIRVFITMSSSADSKVGVKLVEIRDLTWVDGLKWRLTHRGKLP